MPSKHKRFQAGRKGARLINQQTSLESLKTLPLCAEVKKRLKTIQIINNGFKKEHVIKIVAKEIKNC